MSTVPTKANAVLLDAACDIIASKMNERLSWLDNAYGRCEKYVNAREVGSDEVYPAIYTGGRGKQEYLILLPDEGLRNFMFIDVDTNQDLGGEIGQVSIKCNISLIFWFDYREVYASDHENRTIENVKYDILKEINKGFTGVRFNYYSVQESSKEIYSTFSTRIADSYYEREGLRSALLRPFGGLRFDGELNYSQLC